MLAFSRHVKKSFAFLVSEYGFTCTEADDFRVRYTNDRVFVDVRYDNGRSYELDVEVGENGVLYNGQERPFNLGELLRLQGVEKLERYTYLQASDQTFLIKEVERLAELLKKYGNEFLIGNKNSFVRLAELRERECEQYAIERDLRRIRVESEKAWKSKDYKKVIELYDPVKSHITPSEKKKLEYAKKHSN